MVAWTVRYTCDGGGRVALCSSRSQRDARAYFGTLQPYTLTPLSKLVVAPPAPTANWSADLHRPIGGVGEPAKHEFRTGVRL